MILSQLSNSFSHYARQLYRGRDRNINIQSKKHDVASSDTVIDTPLSPEEMTWTTKNFIKEFEQELKSLSNNIPKEDLEKISIHKRNCILNLSASIFCFVTGYIISPKQFIDVNEPYNISSSFSYSSFGGMVTGFGLGVLGWKFLGEAYPNYSEIKAKKLHIQASQMGTVLLSHIETIHHDKDDNLFFNDKTCSGNELMFLQDMCQHLYNNKESKQDNNFVIKILKQIFALKNKKNITTKDILKIFADSVKESNVAIDRLKIVANKVLEDMEASSSHNT